MKAGKLKYLVSNIKSNGESKRELKKRVQAGGMGGKRCDSGRGDEAKGKVCKMVVRPAVMYSFERVLLTSWRCKKMLRFLQVVTTVDKIRNECIRRTAHIERFEDKARKARLR